MRRGEKPATPNDAVMASSVPSRRSSLRASLRSRPLRRLLFAVLVADLAEHGGWMAILLFAFQNGGVSEVGWVAPLLLVPAIALAPIIATTLDLVGRRRALPIGLGLSALALGATGLAALVSAPGILTYSAAALYSVGIAFRRPGVASVVPWFARTIDELTTVSVAIGWVESGARLAGPAIAGVILLVGSPGLVMVCLAAGAFAGSLVVAGHLHVDPALESHHDPARGPVRTEVGAGFRLVKTRADARAIITALVAVSMMSGALDVGAAAIAADLLEGGESTVSVLITAHGAGFFLGAIAGAALIGRRGIARVVSMAVAASGIAFMGVAGSAHLVPTVALIASVGLFASLASVAGRASLQALAPYEVTARVFGALESTVIVGLALGGLAFGRAAVWFGLRPALAIIGAVCLLMSLLVWRSLRRVDRERPETDAELVRVLRHSPIFAPLSLIQIEQLSSMFRYEDIAPRTRILSRGQRGTEMAVICAGTVRIARGDVEMTCGYGEHVGEMAALWGTVRNADIDAGPDGVRLAWIDVDTLMNRVAGSTPRTRARLIGEGEQRGPERTPDAAPKAEPGC